MNAQEAKRVEEIRLDTNVSIGFFSPMPADADVSIKAQWFKLNCDNLSFLLDLVKRQEEEIGRLPCNGCKWSGMIRPQKCATCCRNKHMKDNYQEATP